MARRSAATLPRADVHPKPVHRPGVGDELDRTARQARLPGAVVHDVKAADTAAVGRRYWTVCGYLLLASVGAVLTTAPADCVQCKRLASGESS